MSNNRKNKSPQAQLYGGYCLGDTRRMDGSRQKNKVLYSLYITAASTVPCAHYFTVFSEERLPSPPCRLIECTLHRSNNGLLLYHPVGPQRRLSAVHSTAPPTRAPLLGRPFLSWCRGLWSMAPSRSSAPGHLRCCTTLVMPLCHLIITCERGM